MTRSEKSREGEEEEVSEPTSAIEAYTAAKVREEAELWMQTLRGERDLHSDHRVKAVAEAVATLTKERDAAIEASKAAVADYLRDLHEVLGERNAARAEVADLRARLEAILSYYCDPRAEQHCELVRFAPGGLAMLRRALDLTKPFGPKEDPNV
jgi:hypothetical protein